MRIAPLKGGGVAVGSGVLVGSLGLELRKKIPPALDRALLSDRYDASLWMWRYMSLAWYLTTAWGVWRSSSGDESLLVQWLRFLSFAPTRVSRGPQAWLSRWLLRNTARCRLLPGDG